MTSAVVPDFDETTKSVVRGSNRAPAAATVPGSVVSRTSSSRPPGPVGKVRAKTSGARLDPPIPRTTALVSPTSRTEAANASSAR